MGERMAFPWELNVERPYHEKRPFHEELARRDSTDSGIGTAEKLDGLPADNETRQGSAKAPTQGTRARTRRGR
jgi:hypothetical protein